jgi:tetratricopeptide (TPR) repeat protein
MRCSLLVLVLSLVAFSPALADQLSPELISGIELMNNGQFLEAENYFHAYTEQRPNDDKALFLLAMIKWKMMWISFYTPTERDELEKLINKVEAGFSLGKDSDPVALFFFTAAIGLRASVATGENRWWEAAQLGKVMKKNSEQLVKDNPDDYDSYYLLGSYNYFADALPGYIKFIRTFLFLPSGNRTEGMKQLIVANQKGTVTAGEAGRTLAIIYTYFEKQHKYGIQMCNNVLTIYPKNYEVGLYKGINIYFQKDWTDAREWMEKLRNEIKAYSKQHEKSDELTDSIYIVPVYRPLEREVRYWIARTLIQQKKYDEARSLLTGLANPEIHQPYWLMRGVFLSLAQIEYKEGHPEDAEPLIRSVLKWPDVKDSHEKAKLLKLKRDKVGTLDLDFL